MSKQKTIIFQIIQKKNEIPTTNSSKVFSQRKYFLNQSIISRSTNETNKKTQNKQIFFSTFY